MNGTGSSSSTPDTALDIVALDCEMVYSTGGMRVARVSVVDSMGKEVFDELVRMDDGVEVMSVFSNSVRANSKIDLILSATSILASPV